MPERHLFSPSLVSMPFRHADHQGCSLFKGLLCGLNRKADGRRNYQYDQIKTDLFTQTTGHSLLDNLAVAKLFA